jgi:hypothetical protein
VCACVFVFVICMFMSRIGAARRCACVRVYVCVCYLYVYVKDGRSSQVWSCACLSVCVVLAGVVMCEYECLSSLEWMCEEVCMFSTSCGCMYLYFCNFFDFDDFFVLCRV